MDKKKIRSYIKACKAALVPESVALCSDRLTELFAAQDFYRDAKVLYAYLAFNQELRTDALIRRAWADGKRVAVPRVLGKREMEFYYIDSFEGLITSSYGIPEPPEDPGRMADEKEVLLLMPGVAFDRAHNRVGYGGGFYDCYLERKEAEGTSFLKVALAYDFQIVDSIPAQPHDRKLDYILTVGEII